LAYVAVHRIGIAHPAVVVSLAVLRQVLLDVPPLVDLATLHLYSVTTRYRHTAL
jgi:hypothetical protein